MIHGSVKMLFYNENADSIVASAGRISTTKGSANEIYEKSREKDKEENVNLIRKILASGHTSVLEHVCINLSFDNVSVFVEQFMIEFRLASFTVKSRRYVDFGEMGYVMPEFNRYDKNVEEITAIYQEHMEYLFREYNDLLDRGIPKEDARFVLPYAFRSNFYCTVNAREFVRIVNEMVQGRGSKYPEIAALGESLMEQCKDTLPFLQFGGKRDTDRGNDIGLMVENQKKEIEMGEELVVLLDAAEHPEEMICRAAMMKMGMDDWYKADVKNPDFQKQIIRRILCDSRKRELEQVYFTILFQRISLAGVTHLVRHRMQSVIVPEYIDVCDFNKYIIPESVVAAGRKEQYENVFRKTETVVRQLQEKGLKNSDRVYLFLSGLTVPVMTTMNANELLTFIQLRTCNRAQWEIADNAKSLLSILRTKYPVLFSCYGPACYVTGVCPEGKMSCGQMKEIRRSFMAPKAFH